MNKKLIRLTENDLHRIIKESVNKVLTELDWKTYASAALERSSNNGINSAKDLINYGANKYKEQYKDDKDKGLEDFKSFFNGKSKYTKGKGWSNESTNKITESDLHRVIKESVKSILSELDWKTYASAAEKTYNNDDYERAEKFSNASTNKFNKKYGYEEFDDNLDYYGEKAKQDVKGNIYPNGKGQVGMGSYTPKHASMHGVQSANKDYAYFNPNSKMKPSSNIVNKFNTANNEMNNYYNDKYEYQKGKGYVKK